MNAFQSALAARSILGWLCALGALLKRLLPFLLAVNALIAAICTAEASTWEDAIGNVEAKAADYHRRATDLGFPVHAGTALNELDIPIHRCSILGRMLGKTSLITHLEKDYPTTSTTGAEFWYAAISLGNWAYTARNLLELDEARRVRYWNLDCVGQHGISGSAYLEEKASRAFFDVVEGKVIRILGNVTTGFAKRLEIALLENPRVELVALGSGGGVVSEALVAGRLIRGRKLSTTLWNNCYSACSLVFLGGVDRTIWSPYPKLGFHMVSAGGVAVPSHSDVYAAIDRYATSMSVVSSTLIGAMLSARPDTMRYLSHDEMCRSRITTWIQRSCWAQIR